MLSPTTDTDVSNLKSIVCAPDERLVLLVDVPVDARPGVVLPTELIINPETHAAVVEVPAIYPS